MAQETVKALHSEHYRNLLNLCTTVTELDNTWANRLPGGINQAMWDVYGHYFARDLAKMAASKRGALGGSGDVILGGSW